MPRARGAAPALSSPVRQALHRLLPAWYRRHHRPLPWRAAPRHRPDPYHVLVSEAMLQQTQVATVVAYFQRFLAAFPTLESLARAPDTQVLRLWQGLGYYHRALNLQRAAAAILERHAGSVPRRVNALRELPGVGRYTAGAIASIAYDVRAPVLDGNVTRVLSRLFALRRPVDQPQTQRTLWALAEAVLPRRRCGDFNQALMELGAVVCTPRSPACPACPLRAVCRARRQGLESRLPRVPRTRRPRPVTHHVLALRRQGRLLFERRPTTGLWPGLWQLPTLEDLGPEAEAAAVTAGFRRRLGVRLRCRRGLARTTWTTTHRAITFRIWEGQPPAGPWRRRDGWVWRNPARLDGLALSTAQRRVLAVLAQPPSRSASRRSTK